MRFTCPAQRKPKPQQKPQQELQQTVSPAPAVLPFQSHLEILDFLVVPSVSIRVGLQPIPSWAAASTLSIGLRERLVDNNIYSTNRNSSTNNLDYRSNGTVHVTDALEPVFRRTFWAAKRNLAMASSAESAVDSKFLRPAAELKLDAPAVPSASGAELLSTGNAGKARVIRLQEPPLDLDFALVEARSFPAALHLLQSRMAPAVVESMQSSKLTCSDKTAALGTPSRVHRPTKSSTFRTLVRSPELQPSAHSASMLLSPLQAPAVHVGVVNACAAQALVRIFGHHGMLDDPLRREASHRTNHSPDWLSVHTHKRRIRHAMLAELFQTFSALARHLLRSCFPATLHLPAGTGRSTLGFAMEFFHGPAIERTLVRAAQQRLLTCSVLLKPGAPAVPSTSGSELLSSGNAGKVRVFRLQQAPFDLDFALVEARSFPVAVRLLQSRVAPAVVESMQRCKLTCSDKTAALGTLSRVHRTTKSSTFRTLVRSPELQPSARSSSMLLSPLQAPAAQLGVVNACAAQAPVRIFGHHGMLDEPSHHRFLTDWSLVCVFHRRIRFVILHASPALARRRLLLFVPAAIQLPANPGHLRLTLGFALDFMQRCRFSRTAVQTPEQQHSARSMLLQQLDARAVDVVSVRTAHHAPTWKLQLSASGGYTEATDASQRISCLSTSNDVIQAKRKRRR